MVWVGWAWYNWPHSPRVAGDDSGDGGWLGELARWAVGS